MSMAGTVLPEAPAAKHVGAPADVDSSAPDPEGLVAAAESDSAEAHDEYEYVPPVRST